MKIETVNIIFSIICGGVLSWMIYVTKKLITIDYSVKYINKNLHFVDWDKIPSKKLNDVFNSKD